jgi:hypothetical protein
MEKKHTHNANKHPQATWMLKGKKELVTNSKAEIIRFY